MKRDEFLRLSPREREIWWLLAQGKSNKEIAYQLGLSINTVKMYVHRLYLKLNVACRSQAVAAFFQYHSRPKNT